MGPLPVQALQQGRVEIGKGAAGEVVFHGQPAGQVAIVALTAEIARQQEQPVPQHIEDALQLACGTFVGLQGQFRQGIVQIARHCRGTRQLGQSVGIMLPLKGVLPQLGALVEGIADAPVQQGFHRRLHGQAAGGGAARILPEQDGVLGRIVRGLAEKMVRRVLEPPEDPLAVGLAQQIAQGRIGHQTIPGEQTVLLLHAVVDHAIIPDKIPDKVGLAGQQPAFAHCPSSCRSACATRMS